MDPPGQILGVWASEALTLKPRPHCRRKVRLPQKTVTVAEKPECRRQSHFSAPVWTGLYVYAIVLPVYNERLSTMSLLGMIKILYC